MPTIKNIYVVTPALLHLVVDDDLPPLKPPTPVSDPPLGDGIFSITNVSNNGSGNVRLTISAGGLAFWSAQDSSQMPYVISICTASGINGFLAGSHQFTYVDATTIDLPKIALPGGYSFQSGVKCFFVSEYKHSNFTFQAERAPGSGLEYFRWIGDGQPALRDWNRGTPSRLGSAWSTATQYGVGPLTVTNVHRVSEPIDGWESKPVIGDWGRLVCWRHNLYLSLSSPMTQGATYPVTLPPSLGVTAGNIKFDDFHSVNSAIHVGPRMRPNASIKTAYLSKWVHGLNANNGSVPFGPLISSNLFQIITDGGAVEYTGTISAPKPWNEGAPSYPVQNTQKGISNSGATPWNIANMVPVALQSYDYGAATWVPKNGWQITCTGTTPLVENQTVAIGELPGCRAGAENPRSDLQCYYHIRNVNNSNPNARTCTLHFYAFANVAESLNGIPVGSDNATPYAGGGKMWPCVDNNPAGVDVWQMDFSGWTPTRNGIYRVRIPGLGTSLPFLCDQAAAFDFTKAYLGAEFLQRHGQDFSGNAFGVQKSRSPRVEKTIHKSKMPAVLSSECFAGLFIRSMGLPEARHNLGTVVGSWYEGVYTPPPGTQMATYADAGDPDLFPGMYHHEASNGHFLTWLQSPSATRNAKFGLPTMEATFGSAWAGTDALGDLLVAGLYQVIGLRYLKNPTTKLVAGGIQQTGTSLWSPWAQNPSDWYVYDYEHLATFNSAQVKFLAAKCLKDAATQFGGAAAMTLNARAVELDIEAAEEYNAANEIFINLTAARARYDAAFAIAGYSQLQKDAFFSTSNASSYVGLCKDAKVAAAASGYLSTGTVSYRTDFDAIYNSGTVNFSNGAAFVTARVCYALSSSPTPSIKTEIDSTTKTLIEGSWAPSVENTGATGEHYRTPRYSGLGDNFGDASFGADAAYFNILCIYYCEHINKSRGLKLIEAKFAYQHGGNQANQSYATGIGHNPFVGVLHVDLHANGMDPLKYRGIGVYGPNNLPTLGLQISATNNWNAIASELETVPRPGISAAYLSELMTIKGPDVIVPPIHSRPTVEKLFPVRDQAIEMMEFTVNETIGQNADLFFYLHMHDANTQTALYGGRKRFQMKLAA